MILLETYLFLLKKKLLVDSRFVDLRMNLRQHTWKKPRGRKASLDKSIRFIIANEVGFCRIFWAPLLFYKIDPLIFYSILL